MGWYYSVDGKEFGPTSEAEIKFRISSKSIKTTDGVKAPGMNEWIQANEASRHFVESPLIVMRNRYANLSNKKRLIILGIALAFSAIPYVGWVLIAPWLVPWMIYLEYNRP